MIKCAACYRMIHPGETFLEYKGKACCDDPNCMKELLFNIHEGDFTEQTIRTESDSLDEYYDSKCDEMRAEGRV